MARHKATQAIFRVELDHVKSLLVKTPQLGEDGFLSQCCPAPVGTTQKAYESRLLRAGYYFLHELGDPDGGIVAEQETGEAMEVVQATATKFPGIPEAHIKTAIQHIHLQAYLHPLE